LRAPSRSATGSRRPNRTRRSASRSGGYPAEALDWAPASAVESFTGAGNARAHINARPGEAALDVGCGAGLDAMLTAREVGATGSVVGLDFSAAMVEKAEAGARASGLENLRFVCAPADAMPFENDAFDLVTFNGILNLSPERDAILREIARVLRPGGRLVFAEIVLDRPIEAARETLDDWFRCIGGAEIVEALTARLGSCGLIGAETLELGRNARTGHEASRCGIFTASVA